MPFWFENQPLTKLALEDARRKFYVAVTRAVDAVILIPGNHFGAWGQTRNSTCHVSCSTSSARLTGDLSNGFLANALQHGTISATNSSPWTAYAAEARVYAAQLALERGRLTEARTHLERVGPARRRGPAVLRRSGLVRATGLLRSAATLWSSNSARRVGQRALSGAPSAGRRSQLFDRQVRSEIGGRLP